MLLLVDPQLEEKLETRLGLQSCIVNLLEADAAPAVQITTVCLYAIYKFAYKLLLICTSRSNTLDSVYAHTFRIPS